MNKYRYLVVFMIVVSMVQAGCSGDVKDVTTGGNTIEVYVKLANVLYTFFF